MFGGESMLAPDHEAAAPGEPLLSVSRLPAPSAPTHSVLDGQSSRLSALSPGTAPTGAEKLGAPALPSMSVPVITAPDSVPMKHCAPLDGQENADGRSV